MQIQYMLLPFSLSVTLGDCIKIPECFVRLSTRRL